IMLNPITCEYENIGYEELFGMTVKVIGANSGEHEAYGYYMFNNNKQVILKLKAAQLLTFLGEQKITLEQLIGWFVSEGLLADLEGIKFHYTIGDEWFKIYLSHFSKIAIGIDNSVTDVNIIKTLPTDYQLAQNYPNPFNPSTTISYSLPKDGFTKLTVYNSIGVEVKTLVSENKIAGNYVINFNAGNLPSGIYFYDLSSGTFRSTKKMILIK
ncbi:MAG: T9SS type A sorting domain-containing protein, partial [Ignavibacteriae bacterium]|nr:T9SS type A sorting domain-containing protein [Ignavibacteriota bacterium]